MSRTIKAIKLLHILKDTFKEDNQYIKVSKILETLETDDRNIRRIVKLINGFNEISIESKTGKDGGYRLTSDIYSYFLGISIDELDSLKVLQEAFQRLDTTSSKERSAFDVLNKLINGEIIEDTPPPTTLMYGSDDSEDENEFIIL